MVKSKGKFSKILFSSKQLDDIIIDIFFDITFIFISKYLQSFKLIIEKILNVFHSSPKYFFEKKNKQV